jgi:hypothetical protein
MPQHFNTFYIAAHQEKMRLQDDNLCFDGEGINIAAERDAAIEMGQVQMISHDEFLSRTSGER